MTLNKPGCTKFQSLCIGLAACCVAAGALGMVLSFCYLDSARIADVQAGAAGFVAGSVLVAGGVIALSLLCLQNHQMNGSYRDFASPALRAILFVAGLVPITWIFFGPIAGFHHMYAF